MGTFSDDEHSYELRLTLSIIKVGRRPPLITLYRREGQSGSMPPSKVVYQGRGAESALTTLLDELRGKHA